MIRFAPNPVARLCMNFQWRAGLTISEALAVMRLDVHLAANPPDLRVGKAKRSRARIVPIHRDLGFSLMNAIEMWNQSADDSLINATRQQVWAWYKNALELCYERSAIPEGKPCGPQTLRHSAARYWLLNGVPINVVSKWLGHPNLSKTMIYAESVGDPGGFMERLP